MVLQMTLQRSLPEIPVLKLPAVRFSQTTGNPYGFPFYGSEPFLAFTAFKFSIPLFLIVAGRHIISPATISKKNGSIRDKNDIADKTQNN